LAAAGVVISRKKSETAMFYCWLVAMILFVVIVGYGNRHPWYQLPFVPIVAAFAGSALDRAWSAFRSRRYLAIGAVAVVMGVFAQQSYSATRLLYRPAMSNLRILGFALKAQTPPGSLIVVADYGDPTALY